MRGFDDDELSEMLDRHQIAACMQRYARGIDRHDEELTRSAFHDDALDCHGPMDVTVDEFFEHLFPQLADRRVCQHYLMNQSIDLDGDVAHVETYLLLVKQVGEADPIEQLGGRYIDRFERRGGEWKIALRVLIFDWHLQADASRMRQEIAPYWHGTLDRSDISYERPLQPHSSHQQTG